MCVLTRRSWLSWQHYLLLFQDEFNRPLRETEELQTWGLLLSPECSTGGQRSEDSLGDKLPRPLSVGVSCSLPAPDPALPGFLPSLHGTAGIRHPCCVCLTWQALFTTESFPQFYRGLWIKIMCIKFLEKSHTLLTRLNFMDCGMSWNATDPILAYLYKPFIV